MRPKALSVYFRIFLTLPQVEQMILAATEKRGPLSFQDNLSLILAKEHGWTCVTNDKPLRRECESEGVTLIWELELLCILVESGGLPALHSKDMILCIRENNRKYITEDIVQRAFERLGIE